jgi:hypothetical protein
MEESGSQSRGAVSLFFLRLSQRYQILLGRLKVVQFILKIYSGKDPVEKFSFLKYPHGHACRNFFIINF